MAIILPNQFQKIKETVLTAKKFIWAHGKEYVGPINPTAIVTLTNQDMKSHTSLVLAERVPDKFTEMYDGENPLGVMFAKLDDNFELIHWNATSRELSHLMCSHCPGGNIDGLGTDFSWGWNPYSILYRA